MNEDAVEKIISDDPQAQSADIVAENIDALKALFPDAFAEGGIDFAVLRQLLGGNVEDREEKYGLNWHGKRQARQLALTPSTGTLRPCPEESVDWDTTQNLMIEGDNLEVLKLLQKSYAGKVKLIYIDPPYNTGNDFVYRDDFKDNIRNYLQLTGQTDGAGRKLSTNTEASGRFHTDWLNMMYPRLRLARDLLREDGVIFVSISDQEVSGLRFLMNEVFGEEDFSAQFVWKSRHFPDSRATTGVSTDHEYILLYTRTDSGALRGVERDESKFDNPDNDARGPWMSRSLLGLATRTQRPNLHYQIVDPSTSRAYDPPADTGWRYAPDRMQKLIDAGCILFPQKPDGRPREKKFRADLQTEFVAFGSIIDDVFTGDGTAEIRAAFGSEVFDFSKPTALLERLVKQGAGDNAIVLDFFAGSGSTAHAVLDLNRKDGGNRRFILVQLPEPTGRDDYPTVADIVKERVRRVIRTLNDADSITLDLNGAKRQDRGFRVFKLDSTNIQAWDPDRDNLEQTLEGAVDHLRADRGEQDILYELLLKLGLDLCVPIQQREIAGKEVHSVGGGALIVCLAPAIARGGVEALANGIVAWHEEVAPASEPTCVFRDSAFADDVAKTNLAEILKQHGLKKVMSL
jgi:adenine-specific DNA-methyltransferase